MIKLSCAHAEAERLFPICVHLWENRTNSASAAQAYHRCFSGSGLERRLFCKECGEKRISTDALSDIWICEECFSDREESGRRLGDWGVPGFQIRETRLKLHATKVLSPLGTARILKITPVLGKPESHWLALTDRQEVLWLNLSTKETRLVCTLAESGLPLDVALSLIVSPGGDFAVVCVLKGRIGRVIDLASGKTCMVLNRGDYREEHCHFSAAFFEHEGKTLLVHATAWNRLDISDPHTGQILTNRTLRAFESGEKPPPHYLDYFHCGLAVSPNGEWIADNGWVWHPFGIVRTWSLRRWVSENVWESEDGPTVRGDACRSYYWDGPLCWIDDHRLAVWGVGNDDLALLPAVRVIDVTNGQESPPLIGPFGPSTPATTESAALLNTKLADQGVMEFHDYLFAWSPTAGLSAWDPANGARIFEAKQFCPLAYNRATREFFSVDESGNFILSRLTAPS